MKSVCISGEKVCEGKRRVKMERKKVKKEEREGVGVRREK